MALVLEKDKAYRSIGGHKIVVKHVDPRRENSILTEVYATKEQEDQKRGLAIYYTAKGRAGTASYNFDVEGPWTGWG